MREAVLRRTRARRRWKHRALACSGVGTARRSWRFPPVSALLTGVGIPVIIFPPAVECWPELGVGADAVFRGTGARRRWECRALACSGEDTLYGSWCCPPGNGLLTGVAVPGNRLSSCGRMLAGVGRGFACCPPANQRSSEVGVSGDRLLRRRQSLSGLGLSSGERASRRSCASGNSLSSCERISPALGFR